MLYFRKEFKEVTKKHCHFYCFENESNKNRKTVNTNLIAKRPLLMIIIENSKHDVALQ
jgi:hypothetical protein